MENLTDTPDFETLENFLEEEFNPELFYRALRNALEQLKHYHAVEAA